jgi:hypothetical protein
LFSSLPHPPNKKGAPTKMTSTKTRFLFDINAPL